MIAAVSNRGRVRSVPHGGALNADRSLAFLRRPVRDAGREVVLVVGRLGVHRAGRVRARVEGRAHATELRHLPAYAPDHNPSERLNNDLKQRPRRQPQPGSERGPVERTRSVLRVLQRSPARVRACSRPEPVRYAA
jgi:DDE superfamily endonuclease